MPAPKNPKNPKNPNAAAIRDRTRTRLRTLTNAALLAATGATVGIGVVVAHEHPGKSVAGTTTSGQPTGGATGTTGSSDNSGITGNSGSFSTGNSRYSGNSGASSFSPGTSSQSPAVTSGGSGL